MGDLETHLTDALGDDPKALRAEIARLRRERDSAREDVKRALRSTITDVRKNARELVPLGLVNEARCRALAAMYLDEALHYVWLGGVMERSEERAERVRAAIAEIEALGDEARP